ncbi:hypothetical protein [Phytopseudomonas dryadis]|uniref:hypothetical protein n=1 Tax=Phytopseudomonas dryadis TaxID=2487520 RepID=UPI0013F17C5F|nr:hypothetical protein [Pseudomonas dryadis]
MSRSDFCYSPIRVRSLPSRSGQVAIQHQVTRNGAMVAMPMPSWPNEHAWRQVDDRENIAADQQVDAFRSFHLIARIQHRMLLSCERRQAASSRHMSEVRC